MFLDLKKKSQELNQFFFNNNNDNKKNKNLDNLIYIKNITYKLKEFNK